MKPTSTTAAKFHFDVARADGPVLVDFYADWCSMCRHLHPVLDELAEGWDGRIKIVKVDVEKSPNLAERFDIRNIPTLILFQGGEEQLRLIEKARRADIEAAVDAAIDGATVAKAQASHR